MKRSCTVAVCAALIVGVADASATPRETFIPGYTDFPNALRLAQPHEKFIPGYTDFPNALRLRGNAPLTATERRQLTAAAELVSREVSNSPTAAADSTGSFDWSAAGIGAAVGAALSLVLAAALTLLARTRRIARTP
jgi:hypothetical protein